MNINKSWHETHKMPKNATLEKRVEWHHEHLKHCSCRKDLPVKLISEMKKKKLKL